LKSSRCPSNQSDYLLEVAMKRYQNLFIIMTSKRPLEEWGKLLSDVPTAAAILNGYLHPATQIVIRGQSYRIKNPLSTSLPENKSAKSEEPSSTLSSCRHPP
jgi:DNA replication protein DnaC